MSFDIYSFECHHRGFFTKRGFLLHTPEGEWSEVSPFPGKNSETLGDVLEQLKAVQNGWSGPLFPSVAWGLFGLTPISPTRCPVALLLMGTPQQIVHQAERPGYTTAKVKLGDFDVATAQRLASELKRKFSLRIDLQEKWSPAKVHQFCSYFTPDDFEFIEDPGTDVAPFRSKTETSSVWKPMVRGVPPRGTECILSSTFESGVGIRQIGAVVQQREIPLHALGVGTYHYLEDDVLEEPLTLENGYLSIPSKIAVNLKSVTRC